MAKIPCGKIRPKDRPYEVWENGTGWTWRVLRKYQGSAKEKANPYARWYCYVTSPLCPDGEYGDVYRNEVTSYARLIATDYDEEAA